MSAASCPSATKGRVTPLLMLVSSETAPTVFGIAEAVGSLTRL
jgi:hypothetical protein